MRRLTLTVLTMVAVLTATAVGAVAQGFGRGMGARWANVSSEDAQRVADLHQKVRQAQWDLWNLQARKAEEDKVEKKRAEVLRLRGELAKLMTDLPAGPCFQAGATSPPAAVGPGPGRGMGRGPCGMGMGWGRGGGRGMGSGRGAGMCLRW